MIKGVVIKKFTFAISSPDEFLVFDRCRNVLISKDGTST